jgi:hypothetical protein
MGKMDARSVDERQRMVRRARAAGKPAGYAYGVVFKFINFKMRLCPSASPAQLPAGLKALHRVVFGSRSPSSRHIPNK